MKIVYYNQRKTNRKWIKKIIFSLVAVGGIWVFFWLPFFRVKEIIINDPLVSRKEVEEKLGLSLSSLTKFFLPQNNFFLFPSKLAEEAILESGLGVADIEKKFPNKIEIEFKEIKPKFLYCIDKCYYIDKNGIPYEIAPFFTESPLPILEFVDEAKKELKLGKEFLPQENAEFLLNFNNELKNLNISIKKIEIKNDIKITMNENWNLLILKNQKDYKDFTKKLMILFEQKIKDRSKIEYIDMRVENKAFYKLISK